MGGFGSGNHRYDAKLTVGQLPNVDIRRLNRNGMLEDEPNTYMLTWSRGDDDEYASMAIRSSLRMVEFIYRSNGIAQGAVAHVVTTPCAFGGERVWFCCPACNKRCAIVYPRPNIACRHCHNLSYSSRNETNCDQASRQADRIRKRLGWEAGILNGEEWKPKEMHWRTYHRLVARHREYERRFIEHMPHGLRTL